MFSMLTSKEGVNATVGSSLINEEVMEKPGRGYTY